MDWQQPESDSDFVVGKSPQMQTLYHQMQAAAGTEGN